MPQICDRTVSVSQSDTLPVSGNSDRSDTQCAADGRLKIIALL